MASDDIFGVYVHFPFCAAHCTYCDFVFTTPKKIPQVEYTDAVLEELSARGAVMEGRRMASIYLGGGTPSLWEPRQLGRVLDALRRTYSNESLLEVTLEANPGSVFLERLDAYLDCGVTRFSLGVQTFRADLLARLGRQHDVRDAHASLEALATHERVTNFSADLMYGLPGTTVEDVHSDFDLLTGYEPHHISLYGLTVEADTPLHLQVEQSRVQLLSHDASADQSEIILDLLHESSWELYELSNAARPGYRAVHNSLYWHSKPYLGLGVGAHGLEPTNASLDHECVAWARRGNSRSLKRYLVEPVEPESLEILTHESWSKDRLLVALRWLDGVHEESLARALSEPMAKRTKRELITLERDGLLWRSDGLVGLTRSGILRHTDVVLRLFG
jgi:oxygen-independent coproporphyrinogen-3 oxidase